MSAKRTSGRDRLSEVGGGLPVHDAGDLRDGRSTFTEPHVSVDGGARSLGSTKPVVDLRQMVSGSASKRTSSGKSVRAGGGAATPPPCHPSRLSAVPLCRRRARSRPLKSAATSAESPYAPANVRGRHRIPGIAVHDGRRRPSTRPHRHNAWKSVYDRARRRLPIDSSARSSASTAALRPFRSRDFEA